VKEGQMKLFGYRWPLVLWSTYDHLVTENNSLKRHLVETQKELLKHRLLLGRLADADKETEEAFARAKEASRAGR
jgi:hypothetical protein